MTPLPPLIDITDIAALSRRHLESVVAIDSQSDERSASIPSSEGQRRLAAHLAEFFEGQGCRVERDAQANVLAALPGRGAGAGKPPLALLVHLDTSRGTAAVPALHLLPRWDGQRVPYPKNPRLCVDLATYPAAAEFLGQSLLFGDGEAPFGLDDKLGLTHLMTLAALLRRHPDLPHPPLILVGRPDEEIGRMAAVEGLAMELERRGVRHGFTVDGILPYEINVENFHGSHAALRFPARPLTGLDAPPPARACTVRVRVGGVNTHGCSAKAEGRRAATRLCAEIVDQLTRGGLCPAQVVPLRFHSAAERDCDGELLLRCAAESVPAVARAVQAVMEPHLARGADFHIGPPAPLTSEPQDRAAWDLLRFVSAFFASAPGFVLPAEESEARQGYSNPYRGAAEEEGLRLDIRLRDFDREALDAREQHVARLAAAAGLAAPSVVITQQYQNLGPRLRPHPELLRWPQAAAARLGVTPRVQPIRGSTGVDPFLDRGVIIGNLGTGYFAPESEKEFTSLEMLEGHARWLLALLQVVAEESVL